MPEQEYISLTEATKYCDYSQEYLSLRARRGKLKALKKGRNWVTTREWLAEYVQRAGDHKKEVVWKAKSPKSSPAAFQKSVAPPDNLPIEGVSMPLGSVLSSKAHQAPRAGETPFRFLFLRLGNPPFSMVAKLSFPVVSGLILLVLLGAAFLSLPEDDFHVRARTGKRVSQEIKTDFFGAASSVVSRVVSFQVNESKERIRTTAETLRTFESNFLNSLADGAWGVAVPVSEGVGRFSERFDNFAAAVWDASFPDSAARVLGEYRTWAASAFFSAQKWEAPGDLNSDNTVNIFDLSILLSQWSSDAHE